MPYFKEKDNGIKNPHLILKINIMKNNMGLSLEFNNEVFDNVKGNIKAHSDHIIITILWEDLEEQKDFDKLLNKLLENKIPFRIEEGNVIIAYFNTDSKVFTFNVDYYDYQ